MWCGYTEEKIKKMEEGEEASIYIFKNSWLFYNSQFLKQKFHESNHLQDYFLCDKIVFI